MIRAWRSFGGRPALSLLAVFGSALALIAPSAAPASSSAQEIARLDAASEALWEQSKSFTVWDMRIPALAVHYFIGCGPACAVERDGISELDEWLSLAIDKRALHVLHRHQLLATLAEYDTPQDRIVVFQDFTVVTAGELLHRARRTLPASHPATLPERQFGVEYGWSLAALCHYLGPEGKLEPGYKVTDLIAHILRTGPNRSLEGGTHEWEGLASCLAKARLKSARAPVYARIHKLLRTEQIRVLDTISPDGQVYAGSTSHWLTCPDENHLCTLLTDLSKQVHFLEWTAMATADPGNPRYQAVIARAHQLMTEVHAAVKEPWLKESRSRWFLYAGSAAHGRSAARKLTALARRR